MLGRAIDVIQRPLFHDLPVVHDHDFVRDICDHTQIMGNEQDRHIQLLLQIVEQFQDLSLDGHVQSCRGLVCDQNCGPANQRHGNHRALPKTAR